MSQLPHAQLWQRTGAVFQFRFLYFFPNNFFKTFLKGDWPGLLFGFFCLSNCCLRCCLVSATFCRNKVTTLLENLTHFTAHFSHILPQKRWKFTFLTQILSFNNNTLKKWCVTQCITFWWPVEGSRLACFFISSYSFQCARTVLFYWICPWVSDNSVCLVGMIAIWSHPGAEILLVQFDWV